MPRHPIKARLNIQLENALRLLPPDGCRINKSAVRGCDLRFSEIPVLPARNFCRRAIGMAKRGWSGAGRVNRDGTGLRQRRTARLRQGRA